MRILNLYLSKNVDKDVIGQNGKKQFNQNWIHAKREVFGQVVQTPSDVKPIVYKWVFVRKRNDKNEILRYKARLVAQGFSQRPDVDYEETYSPVMDAITFWYLIDLVVHENLEIHLMVVVTSYLYGSLDIEIYMKVPEWLIMPEACNSKSQ